MGRKDFQKGMVAGAKPFEDKFRQVSQQLDDFSENFNGKINKVVETNEVIIDALDSMQKKQFFKDNTPVDISVLDKGGRETLLSLLLTLAETEENVNDNQKLFIRSVKKYLNKTDNERKPENYGVLNNDDWTIIETIDGIDETKAIAQAIMEFLFLGYGNHEDYLDEYEDLFDNFSLNRKKFTEITTHIDNIYRATGMEGIAENYGFVPEGGEVTANEYGTSGELKEEHIFNKIELTDGEKIVYENKKLLFSSYIYVQKNSNITFKNCYIIDDETINGSTGLYWSEKNKSPNNNVDFIWCTVDLKGEKGYFISCGQGDKITIKNSLLIGNKLAFNGYSRGYFFIKDSKIQFKSSLDKNSTVYFIKSESILIENTIIEKGDDLNYYHFLFDTDDRAKLSVNNSVFKNFDGKSKSSADNYYDCNQYLLGIFGGEAHFNNTTFENCLIKPSNKEYNTHNYFYRDCTFIKCKFDFTDTKYKEGKVKLNFVNPTFTECEGDLSQFQI